MRWLIEGRVTHSRAAIANQQRCKRRARCSVTSSGQLLTRPRMTIDANASGADGVDHADAAVSLTTLNVSTLAGQDPGPAARASVPAR